EPPPNGDWPIADGPIIGWLIIGCCCPGFCHWGGDCGAGAGRLHGPACGTLPPPAGALLPPPKRPPRKLVGCDGAGRDAASCCSSSWRRFCALPSAMSWISTVCTR